MRRACVALVCVLMLLLAGAAADKSAELNILVLKEVNDKPVRNASVVIHPINKEGKQARGGLQVKTNAEGQAVLHSIPYGKLRLQVLAPGYQTFGEDYEINQPTHEFTVKLKKPQEQFSIYK